MINNKDIKSVIKAMRKQRREEELAQHGKSIPLAHVTISKKTYTRKTKHKARYQ